MNKCIWALISPQMEKYHDFEWGVPVHDDRLLFEFLVLEGAQAGLSWSTILGKRENYRQAFDHFDPHIVARYNESKIHELLQFEGIVRNRLKIQAAVINAREFLVVQQEFGSFNDYLWRFVEGKPIVNHWKRHEDIPASTRLSEILSRDLKKRGFKFVGSTICYAHMQAIGMVNDHTVDCFRHAEIIRNHNVINEE
jgi:DNA-3-methyladenine glycosylase I